MDGERERDPAGGDGGSLPEMGGGPGNREVEDQLRRLREMETLGQLAGGMVHDLNNLLTSTLAHLDLLESELTDAELDRMRDDLRQIRRNTVTGSRMVKHLLSFTRGEGLRMQPVALEDMVHHAVELVRPTLPPEMGVELHTDEVGPVLADPAAVEKILLTLVANAREAMEGGGRLGVRVGPGNLDPEHPVRTGWGDPGDYGVVVVADTGRGMAPETVSRLFQPFSDPREGDEGPGLSMPMVYGLMKQHRGFIEVESEPGSGTTVRLYFRLAEGKARPAREEADAGATKGKVLFVEDDENLLNLGCRILAAHGYETLQATTGVQALEVVEGEGVPDLLITDLLMPEMTGIELLQRLEERGSLPRVLLTSGFQPDFLVEWHRDPSVFPFLEKPWTVEEFLETVEDLVGEETSSG